MNRKKNSSVMSVLSYLTVAGISYLSGVLTAVSMNRLKRPHIEYEKCSVKPCIEDNSGYTLTEPETLVEIKEEVCTDASEEKKAEIKYRCYTETPKQLKNGNWSVKVRYYNGNHNSSKSFSAPSRETAQRKARKFVKDMQNGLSEGIVYEQDINSVIPPLLEELRNDDNRPLTTFTAKEFKEFYSDRLSPYKTVQVSNSLVKENVRIIGKKSNSFLFSLDNPLISRQEAESQAVDAVSDKTEIVKLGNTDMQLDFMDCLFDDFNLIEEGIETEQNFKDDFARNKDVAASEDNSNFEDLMEIPESSVKWRSFVTVSQLAKRYKIRNDEVRYALESKNVEPSYMVRNERFHNLYPIYRRTSAYDTVENYIKTK